MIPKMENTSGLFDTCVSLLNGRQDIPENTCSSILTDYAHFERVEDAFEMLKTMKQNGIELRLKSLVLSILEIAMFLR